MDASLIYACLSIGYGLAVGFSLGVTGGGGSIFAVPLLIYGLAVPARTAVGLSLAIVGGTAGLGAGLRLRAREIEVGAGLLFAGAGIVAAPLGAWCNRLLPTATLLCAFAGLMAVVGGRMWQRAVANGKPRLGVAETGERMPQVAGWVKLVAAGLVAGLLSGLFGVGGGFIIVPALLFTTRLDTHRAVATSLLIIFLISISGVWAQVSHGLKFPMPVTAFFGGGGALGVLLGGAVRGRLSGPALQKIFAAGMWAVALYLLARNLPVLFTP